MDLNEYDELLQVDQAPVVGRQRADLHRRLAAAQALFNDAVLARAGALRAIDEGARELLPQIEADIDRYLREIRRIDHLLDRKPVLQVIAGGKH